MVEPEVGHDGFQLAIGVDVAIEAAAEDLRGDDALRAFEGGEGLLLAGREIDGELLEFMGGEGSAEGDEILRRELQQAGDTGVGPQSKDCRGGCLRVEVVVMLGCGGARTRWRRGFGHGVSDFRERGGGRLLGAVGDGVQGVGAEEVGARSAF